MCDGWRDVVDEMDDIDEERRLLEYVGLVAVKAPLVDMTALSRWKAYGRERDATGC